MDEKNMEKNINGEAEEAEAQNGEAAADDVIPDCGGGDEDKENKDQKKDKSERKKSETKKLKSENEALLRELEQKNEALAAADDKYLRLLAEYDNYRRRSREEKDAVYSEAVSDAVRELLPLFDNLELASKYTADDAEGEAAKGVNMILSSVPGILEKLNVSAFGETGDPFDPNLHNAVMHVEDESLGEGVITDVFQKGYRHGDRVIRFAMVKVAN